jgi:hypothetical protein
MQISDDVPIETAIPPLRIIGSLFTNLKYIYRKTTATISGLLADFGGFFDIAMVGGGTRSKPIWTDIESVVRRKINYMDHNLFDVPFYGIDYVQSDQYVHGILAKIRKLQPINVNSLLKGGGTYRSAISFFHKQLIAFLFLGYNNENEDVKILAKYLPDFANTSMSRIHGQLFWLPFIENSDITLANMDAQYAKALQLLGVERVRSRKQSHLKVKSRTRKRTLARTQTRAKSVAAATIAT